MVDEVLASPEPPTVTAVQRKIRQARRSTPAAEPARDFGEAKNPQIAGLGAAAHADTRSVPARDVLHEIALSLVELAKIAGSLPMDAQTERDLERVERSVAAIRRAIEGRR
jgi:hypothetical protein